MLASLETMTGGDFPSLARGILESVGANPLDDPCRLVCMLADGPLASLLGPYPVSRALPTAPAYLITNGPGRRRAGGRAVIEFADHPLRPKWGERVLRGLAHVVLHACGKAISESSVNRLAGWIALPDERATIFDAERHPYASADFLVREVGRRAMHVTGVFPVRRLAGGADRGG